MADRVSQEDLDTIKESIQTDGIPGAMAFINDNLDKWKSVPLSVALVGKTGVGKSSFINAVLGLKPDDKKKAAVGFGDTTQKPKNYPHPDNKNIVFWDLPGVGTVQFPREKYLSMFDLRIYDFFIIVGECFTEDDAWLAKEIRRQGKRFFCVRTKIDNALDNAKYDRGQNYDENQVIEDIKKKCIANLKVDMAEVYAVNNRDKERWDFPRLLNDILASLPEQKRLALLLTLGPLTKQVIQMKADALRQRVWKVAIAAAVVSGAASVIPLAGGAVSALLDISVLVGEVVFYMKQFGLNPEALEQAAKQHRIPSEHLGQVLKTATLAMTQETIGTIICIVISETTEAAISQTAKVAIIVVVPVVGAIISGALSFASAVFTLRSMIEKLQKDAERVADRLVANTVESA